MPRFVEPLLRQMYERANPNVSEFVELATPDVGLVLRRWPDQFSVNPPRLSETPATTTQPSPNGGMMLKATAGSIASLYTDNAINIPLSVPDQSKILRGAAWSLDKGLKPLRIRSVTVKIHVGAYPAVTQFELQIYRMRGVPGRVINSATGAIVQQMIQYTPTPLLPQPARVDSSAIFPVASATHDVTFDLTAYQLDIQHVNVPAPSLSQVGEVPELLFEVWLTNPAANGIYTWQEDNTTARTIAGVGTFQDVTWDKRLPNGTLSADPNNPLATWTRAAQAQVPCIQINVDTYPATSQEVYAIALARAPVAASLGRVVFVRELLLGTSMTAEISTAGSGGPWTAVKHGDVVATKQATYHLRATLNSSSDTYRSPVLEALGIEFRTPVDLSAEATVEPIPQDFNVPILAAAIGEGKTTVVKTGRHDYHDPISDVLTASAATQLELDHYVGSRHPSITRDLWLHLGRNIVSTATPAATSEILALISYQKALKRQIPSRAEIVSAVLAAIAGTTATAINVTGPLPTTSVGHEYDNLNYYIRIASTAVAGLAPGMLFPVSGNPSTTQLSLTAPGMPAALAVGDTFELHSATYQQPKLAWVNADPADAWWNVLTVLRGIPPERIGRGDIGRAGRAGLPPKVADRAPGDTATQNKLLVSRTFTDQQDTQAMIDALSFIMGGVTVEIGGQICYRQIFPVLDPLGNLVIPPEDVAATFDARDLAALQTPRGLESRVTTMSCDYGVDSALGQDAPKPSTVVFSDADAVNWFTQQDLEEIGNSAVPSEIASWCYNTYDGGLYLASTLCRQVVRAFSTGMRLWPFTTVDAHPDLMVGDRVVLITDRYTDYDPTTKVAVRGLWAYSLVLAHVARGGREFRGLMLGLNTAAPVVGGSGTASVGEIGQPSIGNADFDAAGNLIVTLNQGTPAGAGFRVAAASTDVPTDATVDAAAYTPGQSATINLGGGWTVGATLQIKVIAYASSDTTGARSLSSVAHAVVPGGAGTIFIDTLSQTPNYAGDTVSMAWVGHGAITNYDVWVYESARGTGFTKVATGVASPYVFSTLVNILVGGGNANDNVSFYVVGKDAGGHAIATSGTLGASYRYTKF